MDRQKIIEKLLLKKTESVGHPVHILKIFPDIKISCLERMLGILKLQVKFDLVFQQK